MSTVTPELRTPVMTQVEASFEDPTGAWQTVIARMEDKSVGGACVRFKTPIRIGSKLKIQWRFDQFVGTAKYCRSEGREYLVGIQRDTVQSPDPSRLATTVALPPTTASSPAPLFSTLKVPSLPSPQESEPSQSATTQRRESTLRPRSAAFATARSHSGADGETDYVSRPRVRLREYRSHRRIELPAESPLIRKQAGKERKFMGRKWLELAPWHSKKDGITESAGTQEASLDVSSTPRNEKENRMPQPPQPTEKPSMPTAREVPTFQLELLPVDDVYRAAGIMNPRRGYSINKVVEMLQSEHIRGMSKEMKQAAVLMALDAAGIQMDQVRHDAKLRQEALDTYEASQKKLIEAVWARKAEEVVQIQAELESVKAHHMARINRNLEGVAREKASFNNWLTLKQQESQKMAEAVELCLKSSSPDHPVPSHSAVKEKTVAATVPAKPV